MTGQGRARRRSAAARTIAASLLAAVAVGAVGCGADDRDMRAPSAAQTTTSTPPVSPSDAVGTNATPSMELISAAFTPGGVIPEAHTCRGADVSPPLRWANLPAGVTELAVAMVDIDADSFVHWIVTGIPPTVGGFIEGEIPAGAVAGPNSFGGTGWRGPCPPSGTHRYELRLFALSGPPNIVPGADASQLVSQLNPQPAVAVATLTGTVAA